MILFKRKLLEKKRFPKKYNDQLLLVSETKENVEEITECVFDQVSECEYPDKITTIIPINSGGGERLGTLVLARFGKNFTVDDLVLAEYSATIVGMEILRSKQEEYEEEVRKKSCCSNGFRDFILFRTRGHGTYF